MNNKTLKSWKMEHGVLISPKFRDEQSYERARKFLVRSFLHAECDDRNLILKITTKGASGSGNLERLKKMEIINS